jgi:hypothetical protein
MGQEHIIAIGISVGLSAVVAYFWVRGIDYMKENHPDYKGEDFLDWENAEAPWVEDWDDEKVHTEGEIG